VKFITYNNNYIYNKIILNDNINNNNNKYITIYNKYLNLYTNNNINYKNNNNITILFYKYIYILI